MRQRAVARSSAGDVLVWLDEHATALLVGAAAAGRAIRGPTLGGEVRLRGVERR